ncbi:hypothetical protein [Amycolatopsis sp. WAC 04182]|uniref:hypothetical protein n=1 Tax=Amycolatopsis sp. WAC 04182 TaxID=2203198 RepID=UPI000F78A8B5|nr:hypothetical protein [Amycolatopsis sp. WAC 04182]
MFSLAPAALAAPSEVNAPVDVSEAPASTGDLPIARECSPIPSLNNSLICVSTGPGIPTTVWFDNRSGSNYGPTQLKVSGLNTGLVRFSAVFTSRPGAINGAEWSGFANDCYYGAVKVPGRDYFHRTAKPACV